MLKILMIMTFFNSMMFIYSKTPLSMGLMLLMQTLLITLMSGIYSFNFWYAYILFLILLGSMLILFIYVSSLVSNQKFTFNKNYKIFIFNLLLMMIMIFLIFNMKTYFTFNSDSMNFMNMMNNEQFFLLKMSLNKLYNTPSSQIMILMINYLLLTLFIVVKITNINMGPLRKNI